MKPIELKFGNYIMISRTFETARISTITRHKIGYHTKEHEQNLSYARLDEIEPIEINENVLKVLGFENLMDSYSEEEKYKFCGGNDAAFIYKRWNDEEKTYITICKDRNGDITFNGYNFINPNNHEFNNKTVACNIHYIHELQDLLMFMGYSIKPTIDEINKAVLPDLLRKRQLADLKIVNDIMSKQERKTYTITIDDLNKNKAIIK